jgi:N-acetylglucosamine-6-phosphate deacetylase
MEQAVAMAFLVPGRSLGLDHSIGSMKAGMRAHLIRFTPAWILTGVWIGGAYVTPDGPRVL